MSTKKFQLPETYHAWKFGKRVIGHHRRYYKDSDGTASRVELCGDIVPGCGDDHNVMFRDTR